MLAITDIRKLIDGKDSSTLPNEKSRSATATQRLLLIRIDKPNKNDYLVFLLKVAHK